MKQAQKDLPGGSGETSQPDVVALLERERKERAQERTGFERLLREMSDRVQALESRPASPNFQSAPQMQPLDAALQRRKEIAELTAARVRKMEEDRKAYEAALQNGPELFEIGLTNNPRMGRVVGSTDEANAKAKYMAFFSIRSIIDATIQWLVKPLGPNPDYVPAERQSA